MSTANQTAAPTIQVTFDEIAELFTLGNARQPYFVRPAHTVLFSCSRHGILPAVIHGYHPPAVRELVTGESWLLDFLAAAFQLHHDSRGGRFSVSIEGAYRSADGACIAEFELVG